MGLRPIPAIEPSRRHAMAFVAVVLLSIPMTASCAIPTVSKNNNSPGIWPSKPRNPRHSLLALAAARPLDPKPEATESRFRRL